MMRQGMQSVAQTCIICMQDVLSLDTSARFNCPGVADGKCSSPYPPSPPRIPYTPSSHPLHPLLTSPTYPHHTPYTPYTDPLPRHLRPLNTSARFSCLSSANIREERRTLRWLTKLVLLRAQCPRLMCQATGRGAWGRRH
eukprot:3977039-Pyramimonas_sp.AAC.1